MGAVVCNQANKQEKNLEFRFWIFEYFVFVYDKHDVTRLCDRWRTTVFRSDADATMTSQLPWQRSHHLHPKYSMVDLAMH